MAARVMLESNRRTALGCYDDTVLRGLCRTGSLDRDAAAGETQPSRARSGDSECAWTTHAGDVERKLNTSVG